MWGFLFLKGLQRSKVYFLLRIKLRASLQIGRVPFSMAGRLCLINLVITGSLIHSFRIYKWPVSLLKDFQLYNRNFLWTKSIVYRKLVTVAWDKCCLPRNQGGLGIRCVFSVNIRLFLGSWLFKLCLLMVLVTIIWYLVMWWSWGCPVCIMLILSFGYSDLLLECRWIIGEHTLKENFGLIID